MIPEIVDGVLPEGVHECTIDEVGERFGRFQRLDQRIRLTKVLRQFVEDARKSGIAIAVVIDGSYVTAKEEPSDIDIVLALRPDFDLTQELRPFEYNLQSKRMARNIYKFDVFAALDGSERYERQVDFFSRVRADDPGLETNRQRKGLLRITL